MPGVRLPVLMTILAVSGFCMKSFPEPAPLGMPSIPTGMATGEVRRRSNAYPSSVSGCQEGPGFAMLLASASARDGERPPSKEETAPDSLLHFLGGVAVGLFTASCVTAFDTGMPLLESGGAVLGAAAAGGIKEGADALGFGTVDTRDFFWTLAGGAAAAGTVELLRTSGRPAGTRAVLLAVFGLEFSLPLVGPLTARLHAVFRTSR